MAAMRRTSSEELYDIAAAWVARVDGGALAADEHQAFLTWLSADSRHRGAFFRAQAIYLYAGAADLRSTEEDGDLQTADSLQKLPIVSRRRVAWLTAAAAAAAGAWLVARGPFTEAPVEYATKRGEIRAVNLSDGSVMTLNTSSRATVAYDSGRREIRLAEGEAVFEVAKDSKRRFRVVSRDTVVVAVGTKFYVRNLRSEPTTVVVEEGVVDVMHTAGARVSSTQLGANMRSVSYAPDVGGALVTGTLEPAAVENEMAWRDGMIAFRGTTLAEAVHEFDRYGDSKITIEDAATGLLPISGLFSAYRPREFIETVALSLNLRVERDPATGRMTVRGGL